MANKSKNSISILPMRDIIVFPSMIAPVFVSRKFSTVAIENSLLTEEHEIMLVAQKDPTIENPKLEDLYEVGILSKIVQIMRFPDGSLKALVEGISRAKITDIKVGENHITGSYEKLQNIDTKGKDTKALINVTLQKFTEYIQKSTKINAENFLSLEEIKETGKLADVIATYLNMEIKERQQIIETLNTSERLEIISKILSRETEILFLEETLQEKVQFKLGKSQKEYLLREKLRAIKEELGSQEGGNEVDELREKIKKAKAPKYVKEKLNKELNKLEGMNIYTAETSVVRTYIDVVLDLPWNKKSKEIVDIKRAKEILDEDHYGLKDVKERIIEFLAVRQLSKEPQPTIICFVGPPGVGKTSLARSIARSMNREFSQVSLGGINDESEIRGHRRTYIGAMPGRIIRAIQDAGTKNPVVLLDEIEKMLPSHMGDPTAAMLEVLDPAQNSHFTDHYIDMPFDLSETFFIATGNSMQYLYKPLKDRIETIELPGYTEDEKLNIAQKFLIPREFKLHGINEEKLQIKPSALKTIIECYTRESGVRELERNIAKLCRKFAVEFVKNPNSKICVDKTNTSKYLGTPKFTREETEKEPQVGLVHGLAWTEVGGEILEIEASIMPGKGTLNLTGRLGEVMQESAKAALSFTRSHYKDFDLPADIQEKYDIHVHAADGATPKDGPSAGIGLTLAIISALTGRPTRGDIAMTGEITLRGRVLPIGGLKEKSIAALRSNMKYVIIPKGNEKDLNDIPEYIKDKITFKPVENMSEVINFALLQKVDEFKPEHNGKKKDKKKIVLPKRLY